MSPPRLENRLPPEDLLDRDEHPLRELAWLLAASLAALALLVAATGLAARWLAPKLPFQVEQALAERLFEPPQPADPQAQARLEALQALADRVAAVMDLPPGMQVLASDQASEQVNAYATIGGHIRIFHGLLRRLDSEEALAALLAHEIAHVKHRHVATAMGHGMAVVLVLAVVAPDQAARAAQGLLGGAAQLALLGYSREKERQADAEALAASLALYGHGGGLVQLFAALPKPEGAAAPSWLNTHPETGERLAALRAEAARRGASLQATTAATPLADALRLPAVKARSGDMAFAPGN